jgi:histone acetyltransferase (RNA polymerase elongator complex component)
MWRAGAYREHTVEDAVRICAKIVPMFEAAGIPIIRLGLNPTEELSGGAAAGGAYHPALGELVKSRILLEKARALLQGIPPGKSVVLTVGKGKTSQMAGQHRENIRRLTEEFSLAEVKIREEPETDTEITLISIEK